MLYKYYSINSDNSTNAANNLTKSEPCYAIENLRNEEVSFTSLDSLNDPLEGIGSCLLENSGIESPVLKGTVKQIITEELQDVINFKYRVFCATKKFNNPLLWAYYANAHKGFCVGYEDSDIKEISDHFDSVKYCKERPLFSYITESDCKKLLYYKSIYWNREEEYRAVYVLKEDDILDCDASIFYDQEKQEEGKIYKSAGGREVKSTSKFFLKRCKAKEIYLGMKMKKEDRKTLIEIADKKGIKVYNMYLNSETFDLERQELSERMKEALCNL